MRLQRPTSVPVRSQLADVARVYAEPAAERPAPGAGQTLRLPPVPSRAHEIATVQKAAPAAQSLTAQALSATDSYASTTRSMGIPEVLDAVIEHADPKLGVFAGGLRDEHTGAFRTYKVVGADGKTLVDRTATYDGKKAYLYVPAHETEALAQLQQAVATNPKYRNVVVMPLARETLDTHEERMKLKYDRPGIFWVSSSSPATPSKQDANYIVPGGRFGIELYYHDTRINLPSARNTVAELARKGDTQQAEAVLSAMRGTVNALANEVTSYGKIFNATLSVNAGRSQAPALTNGILETYRAWTALLPEESAEAKAWLRWASDAAKHEYTTVWTSEPRFDRETGLSRYIDESASIAPEEDPEFYAGIEWSADDIISDASIREHGWDSMSQSILTDGPDKGKPRVHHLLPVCLNSLLYRYEKDLAKIARELDGPAGESEAAQWEAKAAQRRDTMNELMWNEETGLFNDVVKPPHAPPGTPIWKNGVEDLRAYAPLWAGIVEPNSAQAKRMHKRIADFMRPGGVATSTADTWDRLHALNKAYTERCQWGHKDGGWPITTYETVVGLRNTGAADKANEIAYRWAHMVQNVMQEHGGARMGSKGGMEAPIFEKMDVTRRSAEGAATIGYGNQGAGDEDGDGAGFRWGLDAYKLLVRELPAELQAQLQRNVSPDVVFDPKASLRRKPQPSSPSLASAHL